MTNKKWWRVGVAAFAATALMACCATGNTETAGNDDVTGEEVATEVAAELTPLTWISPRGSIDVMDDYMLHVALEMGYFEQMGLEVTLEAGPADATATTKFVAEGKADVGVPSPGVLASSVDTGVPVIGIYNSMPGQIFNFAVAPGSDIKSIADLAGRSISVASPGWALIINPMLLEAGVDPESITYVEAGAQWGQAVVLGQADAALGWEGMRAQWAGQGLEVTWILGRDFSTFPSNTTAVATSSMETAEGRDVWTRFLTALVMGEEFARANPAAAAQITYTRLPDLAATIEPQLALESMMEIQAMYGLGKDAGVGWGLHNDDGWSNFLEVAKEIGVTSRVLSTDEVYTNELLEAVNSADMSVALADAAAFELNGVFAALKMP